MSRDLPLLVLDLGLDIINGVGGLNLEGDGLSSEGLDEDLHLGWRLGRVYATRSQVEGGGYIKGGCRRWLGGGGFMVQLKRSLNFHFTNTADSCSTGV